MFRIEVTKVKKSARCISVQWKYRDGEYVSNFYHKSDGSWGMDPWLAEQPVMIRSILWILANDPSVPANAKVRTAKISYR